ncbi:MAG: glycosyltransferase family 2 protein [Roseomonas sp.]|nr:glycosyltransferase family 2 protein [Roseomonas sp.]
MIADIFFTNRKEGAAAPDISYVVTLYQKLSFLPFLCAGLESQRGDMRAEFIFIDDGSTDGTPEALRERIAAWPEVLIMRQQNTGPAPALNRGLALARGRFIKPMDGDDILLPWASDRMLKAMLGTNASAALAQGDEQSTYLPAETRVDEIAALPVPDEIPAKASSILKKSLRRAHASPSHWMFEAALLTQIKGCDPGVFIQDYSLELEIALASKVAITRGPLLRIPSAAPGRLSDNEAQILHDINLALLRFLRRHPELPVKLRRFALQRAVQRAASWAFRRGGANLLHPASLLRIPAALGLLKPDLAVQKQVCNVFRATHPIRLMPGSDQA